MDAIRLLFRELTGSVRCYSVMTVGVAGAMKLYLDLAWVYRGETWGGVLHQIWLLVRPLASP